MVIVMLDTVVILNAKQQHIHAKMVLGKQAMSQVNVSVYITKLLVLVATHVPLIALVDLLTGKIYLFVFPEIAAQER